MKSQRSLLALIITLFWFAMYSHLPYQTPYLALMGISSTVVGTVVGAYGISQLIIRLPVGIMADAVNKHKFFVFGGCLSTAAASLIRLFFDTASGYLVANIFSGLAASLWISFMVMYLNMFGKNEQQRGTGSLVFFNNLGTLLVFVFGTFLYDRIDMRGMNIAACAAGFAGAVFALFLKEPAESPIAPRPSVITLLRSLKRKKLLIFTLFAIVQQGIQMTTAMSFTNQIIEELGGSSVIIGLSSTIYMLSAVASSAFVSSPVCSRRPPKVWITFGFLCSLAYCLLVPTVGSVYVILALQIFPGINSGILYSLLMSEALEGVEPDKRSSAMGFFQALFAVGTVTFPMITGKLADLYSMKTGFFMMAGLAAVTIILVNVYYKMTKEKALK